MGIPGERGSRYADDVLRKDKLWLDEYIGVRGASPTSQQGGVYQNQDLRAPGDPGLGSARLCLDLRGWKCCGAGANTGTESVRELGEML